MHLSRDTITAASRIMLPTYPVVIGALGLIYLLGGAERTDSPAFETAKWIMPMQSWGLVFLALALALVSGYAMRSRDVIVFVLIGAALFLVGWGACFAWSIVTQPAASLAAPLWPWFMATACLASATSVVRREGADARP